MVRKIYQSKAINVTEQELITACQRKERKAQRILFDRYSPKMLGVCRRYVRDLQQAEDVLVEGLYKVLTNIDSYRGEGSFEGWIRRIVVNQALMYLRKKNPFKYTEEIANVEVSSQINAQDELAAQDILNLLEQLPTGYRTVFNLYVVEGYKHREIAALLNISINTSKSQLILAKKRMRELVQRNQQYPGVG